VKILCFLSGNATAGDTLLTRYLFTRRALDTDTGLQYNCARWYDTAVGRWVRADRLDFAVGSRPYYLRPWSCGHNRWQQR